MHDLKDQVVRLARFYRSPRGRVQRGFGNPFDLINDPDIHIVTVATPVPTHHGLITAALRAGKHVVTEWPVEISTARTEELALLAEQSGLRTAVDLQARMSPAARRARDLVRSGAIGRVLYATVLSTTTGFGPAIPDGAKSLEDPATGMNLTTIQAAHTIDLAVSLTGPLSSLSALATVQYPQLTVGEHVAPLRRTLADHVLEQGRLSSGGALSVQVIGGRPPGDAPFRLDIVGEDGTLALTGGAMRGFQAGLLTLALNGQPLDAGDNKRGLSKPATNVAHVYTELFGTSPTAPTPHPVSPMQSSCPTLSTTCFFQPQNSTPLRPGLPGPSDALQADGLTGTCADRRTMARDEGRIDAAPHSPEAAHQPDATQRAPMGTQCA